MSRRARILERLAAVNVCDMTPAQREHFIATEAPALQATPDYLRLFVDAAMRKRTVADTQKYVTVRARRFPRLRSRVRHPEPH